MKHTSETGRSMLEMLGVIGVLSVLAIASITATSFIGKYYKATRLHIEVEDIASRILDLFSWSKTFDALNSEFACNNDIFDRECKDDPSGGTGHTKLGQSAWGNIRVISNGNSFDLIYENIDPFTCRQILAHKEEYKTMVPNLLSCSNAITSVSFTLR